MVSSLYPTLPTPPNSAELAHVLPYLWQVAVADATLRSRLASATVGLLLAKSLGLAVPLLFKRAVDALASVPAAGAGGAGAAAVQTAVQAAVLALVLSGSAKALSGLAAELRTVSFMPVAQSASRRVALHAFEHILSLDLSFHLERRTGSLSRTIERGTRSVAMIFRAVVFTFVPTIVELVVVCVLLWRTFSPAVVVLVLATFAAYVTWSVALTQLAASRREEANRLDSLSSAKAVDAMLNYECVTSFGNVGLECIQYDGLLRQYQSAAIHAEKASSALNAGQAVILAGGATAALCAAVLGWGGGNVGTVGDLVMANGLIIQVWAPLNFLGFFYRELRQSLVDVHAMFSIMARGTQLPDGHTDLAPSPDGSGLALELRDVHFVYGDRAVLRGVSFRLEAGQSLGIVGESGSGKSTLLRILLRMYDPSQGAVLINGQDARQLRLASLRAAVAVVPQDCVLFADSLEANIAYGRPGAAHDDIVAAASAAQLDRTLRQLPDGLATQVGERGVKLSGGERQRVALARAFLRAPRLLVSDEATSALDSASERAILEAMKQLAVGRTSVSVAHRLSTVQHCDRIIVMHEGRLVEEGSHAQLLQLGGLYASMWQKQADQPREEEMEATEEEERALDAVAR